jgi:hypothetical protein
MTGEGLTDRNTGKGYCSSKTDFNPRKLPFISDVSEDKSCAELTQVLIRRKGTVLTGAWIERLENSAKSHGIREPLPVVVPGHARAPAFQG